jgi:integrase
MAYKKSLKKNLYRGSHGNIFFRKMIRGRTIQVPCGTKLIRVANNIRDDLEFKALSAWYNPETGRRYLPFPKLVGEYLAYPHEWSDATRKTNINTLMLYLQRGLPKVMDKVSVSTVNTCKSRVNTCIRWGLNRGIETNKKLYSGNLMTEARSRVFSNREMSYILSSMKDDQFRLFVNFAYFTGARRGELLNINYESMQNDYIEMTGKTGMRLVKINHQAKKIYQEADTPWQYKLGYISKHFKKELRRLKIPNGRFQDLRRTFGFNLIKEDMPIYQVAKLLGHSKISQTERNYAPLLVTDIKDFTLHR